MNFIYFLHKYLPSEYVQSIITSLPYFGHRNYSGEKENLQALEFGQEAEPREYVNNSPYAGK